MCVSNFRHFEHTNIVHLVNLAPVSLDQLSHVNGRCLPRATETSCTRAGGDDGNLRGALTLAGR